MKFQVFKFENVTSTNDIAIELIKRKGEQKGLVCAKKQNSGRGTKGRKWISEEGNFFGSIFFPLESSYPSFDEFSIINPVIISNVMKNFFKGEKINFKWPNDVFVNKKKICGILQEVITLNDKKFLIIGIGINILSNPDITEKYQTTNIFKETKKKTNIEEISNLIILSYENFFIDLNSYNYLEFKKKVNLMSLN